MKRVLFMASLVGALCVFGFAVGGAAGAAPSNDSFAGATAITSLPFSDVVDITDATVESGEPIGDPSNIGRTVWYSLTPTADAVMQIAPNFPSGGYPTLCDLRSYRFLVVYREGSSGLAGLVAIAGGQWSSAGVQTLHLQAGTTYYVQGGQTWALNCGANTFGLSVSVVPPPANDNFANAIAFSSVPFSDSRDITGATVEQGEPMAFGSSFTQSIWYAFTPTASGTYGAYGVSSVNVYTGTSLANLTPVTSANWPGLYFHATAGTTYYLQSYGGGVNVDVVGPPNADFTYSPGDPSMYDNTTFSYFNNYYWDPTVTGYAWNFGDGTTATGDGIHHQFAHDGDFSVTITVSALGERTNTATKTVQVRTHDVTILSIVAPDKGKVGKQGAITVGIGNTRYPETAQVDLYKVTPQGDVLVGTNIQSVAVMKLKKSVTFTFNYVFTNEDAVVGKVPFKAIATIQGQRDAAPGDNTATSPPTLITK